MTDEDMYNEFLENKSNLQIGTYTYSKQARMFKQELSEERLEFECLLQKKKKEEEERLKNIHFKKWQEGLVTDEKLDNEFNLTKN